MKNSRVRSAQIHIKCRRISPHDLFLPCMVLKTIGYVKSPFKDKFATPRQSQIAQSSKTCIQLDKKKFPPAMLDGLEVGAFIWVLFGFHLNKSTKNIVKVHPPRLRGKKMGVFATRSPHRPNPVGLSMGRIEALSAGTLEISGLDIVNDSPVYDIKPYLPDFDRPRKKQLRWIQENPFVKLKVVFNRDSLKVIAPEQRPLFKKQLKEILQEDPRPLAYLDKPLHTYWLRYADWDVGFEIKNQTATVLKLKKT